MVNTPVLKLVQIWPARFEKLRSYFSSYLTRESPRKLPSDKLVLVFTPEASRGVLTLFGSDYPDTNIWS